MKGLAFISIPIFTRLLVPSDYGVLAIFFSFMGFFSIISGLGIRGSITRYYYEERDDFDSFLGSNLILCFGWSILIITIMIFIKPVLLKFFNVPYTLLMLGTGTAFFSIIFQNYMAYLQASKQSKIVVKLNVTMAISILFIGIIITVLLKENRYYGKAIANFFISIIFVLICIKPLLKLSKLHIKKKHIKYSLIFGIPIVFHLLSSRILIDFDRFIINQLVGNKETGLYSFAYNVGMVQNLITLGMLTAWTPIFYGILNKKKFNNIDILALNFAKIIFIVAYGLVLFSHELVIIMADKKYYASMDIIPIIVISYVFFFLYTMYVGYAFYHKKTYLIAVFTIVAGSMNIWLNYLLIPMYGYEVAAWTTLLSFALLFVLHYCNVKFLIKTERIIKLKVLLPNFFIFIAFVFIYSYIRNITNVYIFLFLIKILLIGFLLFIFFFRNIINITKISYK
jgi:O-antigen/teichoic acid export membrane protein